MPLVTCPDCEAAISDAAPACPKCGRPMSAAAPAQPFMQPMSVVQPSAPMQIEATGKNWKAAQLVGGLVLGAGMLGACGGAASNNGGLVAVGAVAMAGGLVAYLVGRFGGWWSHG
jgi:hypothetical protein